MQANKLMIGDWVKETLNGKYRFTQVDGEILLIMIHHDAFIEPIPLTPEILEKNGFILRGKTYILKWRGAEIHWRKTDGYASITAPSNLKLEGWCSISNGYFCYVHILQHALRLCGLTDLADNFKI